MQTNIIKKSPRQVAEILSHYLTEATDWVEKVEIAGPGFLNFFIHAQAYFQLLQQIDQSKDKFGNIESGKCYVANIMYATIITTFVENFI